jgi:hypothetical protein
LSPSCEKERTRKSTPLDENVVEEVLLQRCVLVMKWSASFIFLFGLSIRAIRLSLKASVWLMRIKKKRKRKRKMKIHQHPLLIGLHDRDLVCGSVILCLLKKTEEGRE